jgi:glycosyltransferase involved in cell wall biosynthesis
MGRKILVTATTFPRWKDDTEPGFVFYLSNLLSKKGHKVTALVPHHFNAKRYELMGNIKVYRFPYFYPYKLQKLCYDGGILENMKKSIFAKIQAPFLFLAELINMKKIIQKEKIDLIHAHWILPQGVLAALFKKIFNMPYIITVHAGDIFPIKSPFFRYLSKMALQNCDYCTANSSYTKNAVLNIVQIDKIKVIPMGVDLGLFSKNKKNNALRKKFKIKGKLILSVGRLAEKKGIKYLIKAMPDVLKKFPDAKLMIVGDGPEKENITRLISELRVSKNVILAGKIRNRELPAYYATADVFAGPSIITKKGDTEGLGVVFLEALASGTCVIGSNVGGIPDIIKNRKNGLLVPQKNSIELGNAIIEVLTNKTLRDQMIENGNRHIKKNFSWNNVAEKFDNLIEKIGQF